MDEEVEFVTASKKKREVKSVKKTEFSLSAPQAQRVSIAGDFNQWNPSSHPLQQDTKGTWSMSLDLKPGKYEYRFLLDGEWQNDPNCASLSRLSGVKLPQRVVEQIKYVSGDYEAIAVTILKEVE